MKVNLRTIIGILGCAAVVSCTTITDEPDISQLPIEFGTTVSRSVVTSPDNMSSFSVWGGYDGVFLFDKTQVNKGENGWTYNGGSQYWVPGKTFNFYAVHPVFPEGSSTKTSVSSNGKITVSGFDCSATGSDAIDLMTAEKTRETKNPLQSEDTAPVPLKFSHDLAKVNVNIKSTGTVVNDVCVKLYGVYYKGRMEKVKGAISGTWDSLTLCDESTTPYKTDLPFDLNTTDKLERNPFGDILLIPHNGDQLSGGKLKVEYKYPGETNSRSSIVELKVAGKIDSWNAGQSYSYNITVNGNNLFVTVTVNEWKEENTSVDW